MPQHIYPKILIDFRSDQEHSTYKRRRDRARKLGEASSYNVEKERFSTENLEKLAAEWPSSVTARRLLMGSYYTERGIYDALTGDRVSAASILAEAMRKAPYVSDLKFENGDIRNQTMSSMVTLYSDASQDKKARAEALFVHAHLLFLGKQKMQALKQYRLAQILLPQDPYFLLAEGFLLQSQGDLIAAVEVFEKAACICGGDDPEVSLYYHAVALMVAQGVASAKAISLLEDYLQYAEADDQRLPETLYWLAYMYGHQGPPSMATAKRYLAKAEEADRRALPVFAQEMRHPGFTTVKNHIKILLKNYKACGNEKCSAAATHPCGLCEQAYYCSEECLHADWPSHKAFCKKHRHLKDKKANN